MQLEHKVTFDLVRNRQFIGERSRVPLAKVSASVINPGGNRLKIFSGITLICL